MENPSHEGTEESDIANVPFLSVLEFERWCSDFVHRCEAVPWPRTTVQLKETDGTRYLKIYQAVEVGSRCFDYLDQSCEDYFDDELDETPEEDKEAAVSTGPLPDLSVEYSIVLAPTYCVPVLYFILREGSNPSPLGIDKVFQYLVPRIWRSVVANVGILGGIGLVNHPITDTVCFWIHPCNTAQGLRDVIGTRRTSLTGYFLVWFGLVASCVGLHIPKELVITQKERQA